MITLVELYEHLHRMDEVSLIELLDLSSEDIVTAFQDHIEERYEELIRLFEENE